MIDVPTCRDVLPVGDLAGEELLYLLGGESATGFFWLTMTAIPSRAMRTGVRTPFARR